MPIEELNQPQEYWNHQDFTKAIVRIVRGYVIPIEKLPKKIDLTGTINDKCQKLIEATMADPKLRERSLSAKVPTDKDVVLISNEMVVGTEVRVATKMNLQIKSSLLGSQYVRYEYPAFTIHTHGVLDVPPSPADLEDLIQNENSDAPAAAIVLTPTLRFLLIRSFHSPDFSAAEARKEVGEWKTILLAKLQQEEAAFKEHMRAFGGALQHQLAGLEARIQLKMLVDRCQKYQIALYVASKDGKFARYSGD